MDTPNLPVETAVFNARQGYNAATQNKCGFVFADKALLNREAHGHIVCFFNQGNLEPVAAQASGDGCADDTGTDDADVSFCFPHILHLFIDSCCYCFFI